MGTLKRSARSIESNKNSSTCFVSHSITCMKDVLNHSATMCTGDIGFELSNGRLPWSTLDGDLRRKGYTIVNWPQGVFRDRDNGISGLSAEDADKLHDGLFVNERRIRFVPCGEGKLLSTYGVTMKGYFTPPECAYNNDGITSLAVTSSTGGSRGGHRSAPGKQARFRVTTAE